ncbi:MAG: PD-(D/E)XK nuclease family protein [Gemmatimonadota bacterium]|nr:PD-(D/E)XK nuclease family protein [Gemmatimonadota bacterium]
MAWRGGGGGERAAEVLDYKTGDTGEISDRVEEYRPQMEAYREAIATMFDIPVNCCEATLLFVDSGRVERVSRTGPPGISLPRDEALQTPPA